MERLTSIDLQTLSVSRLEHMHRYRCASSIATGALLDLACGTGYGAPILLSNPAVTSYMGVDTDREAISEASQMNIANGKFRIGSAFELPFADEEFDSVVTLETLEHLQNPVDALQEFARVLQPKGILIGSVPTSDFEDFCTTQYGPNEYHLQKFAEDELHAILRQFFPSVEIFVTRVSLAAALYQFIEGSELLKYQQIISEGSSAGFNYGSYFFVASKSSLAPDLGDRLGVLSIGGSYFEAERQQIDRLKAAHVQEEHVARLIEQKDLVVVERQRQLDVAHELVHQKDLLLSDYAQLLESTQTELADLRSRVDLQKQSPLQRFRKAFNIKLNNS